MAPSAGFLRTDELVSSGCGLHKKIKEKRKINGKFENV
jgi:hypothetical protein